jgi:hypothetical protein
MEAEMPVDSFIYFKEQGGGLALNGDRFVSETTEPVGDVAVYNGFEVVNTTSLDGTGNVARDGSADGFDFSQTTSDGTLATTISKTMDMTSTPLLGPGSGGGGDDPTDPNADLLATPGPDDDVGYDWPGEYAQRFDGVDKGGDTFDFQPQLTSEPTAPEGGGADGKGYVLTSIQHSATDTSLVDQTDTEASSRLFVGNLTLDSQASVQTGFGGGVVVASGDVNGDNSALGDPITFTYTVTNTSSAYEGTHVLYQDVVIPSLDTDVRKGEWITDVTYEVEFLGQPAETLEIAHAGLLWV